MPNPESEDERRIDHMVDTLGISYADARASLEADKAATARRAELRAQTGQRHERVKAFTHAADTLFSLDD